MSHIMYSLFFFFNDTATTEIYTLSLHDALPISQRGAAEQTQRIAVPHREVRDRHPPVQVVGREHPIDHHHAATRRLQPGRRSEEHTSELQSRQYLVCRLLLEKKKNENKTMCRLQ